MNTIKCPNCGKELKFIRQLYNYEITEIDFIKVKFINAQQALSPSILNQLTLKDKELYAYIKANADALADATFLDNLFVKKIAQNCNINASSIYIFDDKIYTH